MEINNTVYLQLDRQENQPDIKEKTKCISRKISTDPQYPGMLMLPSPAWENIFSYLEFKDICNFSIAMQGQQNDLLEYNSYLFCKVWSSKIESKNLASLVDLAKKKSDKDIYDLVRRFSKTENLEEKEILTQRSLRYFPFAIYCIINQLTDSCKTFKVKEDFAIERNYFTSSIEFTDGGNNIVSRSVYGNIIKIYENTSDTTWKEEVIIDDRCDILSRSFLNFERNKMVIISNHIGCINLYSKNPNGAWKFDTIFSITGSHDMPPLFSFDDKHLCIIDSRKNLYLYSKKQLDGRETWVNQLAPINADAANANANANADADADANANANADADANANANANADADDKSEKILSASFSNDSRSLITISDKNIIEIYSVNPVTTMWSKDITIPSTKLAKFSSDSNQVITASIENENENTVNIYKRYSGNLWVKEHSFGLEDHMWPKKNPLVVENKKSITEVRFNRNDDRQIVISNESSSVKCFLKTYSLGPNGLWMDELDIDVSRGLFSCSDDGNHVVVAKDDSKTIEIYSRYINDIWRRKITIPLYYRATSVKFSSNSSNILITVDDHTVQIYGMDRKYQWICKASISARTSGCYYPSASISPDSSKLIINGRFRTKIFSLSLDKPLEVPPPTKIMKLFDWFRSRYDRLCGSLSMLCKWVKSSFLCKWVKSLFVKLEWCCPELFKRIYKSLYRSIIFYD